VDGKTVSGAGRKFGRIGRLGNRARGSKNEAAVDNIIRITVRDTAPSLADSTGSRVTMQWSGSPSVT